MTEEQKAPKIEFPCDYTIRIMGAVTEDFHEVVLSIVKNHDPEHNGEYTVRDSKKGRFQSVVVTINATGEPQLRALHEELKNSGRVLMVL
ncbi:DUF493 domain-containing protein [Sansalvadorimonas sp. 2012CJ34-2]|uniref:UPF0250 protein M3P05_04130 n=1 Tax=Parendozoicomonas callyspongiae TaxID=2942213 RepID=A0ABT0PCM7_9GAMM|nr:DUF493 domain-containing protein [Sansalvadorimonas sp. 2012CJ34-2]MCL6269130.1 DUF493 domain-containing protein [Sansalvadorimonas sp. 2012CJ34-2]